MISSKATNMTTCCTENWTKRKRYFMGILKKCSVAPYFIPPSDSAFLYKTCTLFQIHLKDRILRKCARKKMILNLMLDLTSTSGLLKLVLTVLVHFNLPHCAAKINNLLITNRTQNSIKYCRVDLMARGSACALANQACVSWRTMCIAINRLSSAEMLREAIVRWNICTLLYTLFFNLHYQCTGN